MFNWLVCCGKKLTKVPAAFTMIQPAINKLPSWFAATTRGPRIPEVVTIPPGRTVCDVTSYSKVKVAVDPPKPKIVRPSPDAVMEAVVICGGKFAGGTGRVFDTTPLIVFDFYGRSEHWIKQQEVGRGDYQSATVNSEGNAERRIAQGKSLYAVGGQVNDGQRVVGLIGCGEIAEMGDHQIAAVGR